MPMPTVAKIAPPGGARSNDRANHAGTDAVLKEIGVEP
jgi:hypothetical protein